MLKKLIIDRYQYSLPKQRRDLLAIQILKILMAFGEIIMIASIGFFVKIFANINTVTENAFLNKIFQLLNVPLSIIIVCQTLKLKM